MPFQTGAYRRTYRRRRQLEQLVARLDACQAEQIENQRVQPVALLGDVFEEAAAVLGVLDRAERAAFRRRP